MNPTAYQKWWVRFWLRVWWYARKYALQQVRRHYPGEYQDARHAWGRDANLGGMLDTHAWVTDGLPDDLALHDGADNLLGLS